MILLVGAGSIGKRHLANLLEQGAQEILVVDLREDRRKEAMAQARSISPSAQIRVARTTEEAYTLAQGQFQAVFIATPPAFHLQEIQTALAAHLPIFCEKPLSTDAESWDRLLEICEEAHRKELLTLVGYNYRFNAQLQQFRRMLQEGAVGRILSVRGTFSENLREWHPWEGLNFYMSSAVQGGGALLDESHLIDLCRWLFGEITEVMGYNSAVSDLKQEPVFKADDLVEILVRFDSGALGSLHMDLFGKYHQKRLEVIGEEGTLFWRFDNTDLESNGIELWKGRRTPVSPDVTRRIPEQVVPSDGKIRNEMYRAEVRYFLESRQAGRHLRPDVPDLRDGLKTLAVLRAARRAARTQRTEPVEKIRNRQLVRE